LRNIRLASDLIKCGSELLTSFLTKQYETLKVEVQDDHLFNLPENQPLIIYIEFFQSKKAIFC